MSDIILNIRGLTKSYGGGFFALKGLDLNFKRGEFTAIIGPSGAGKSTLVRCVNRMVDPSGGEIIFDGTHIEELKGKRLRHCRSDIGMIFQHYNLVGRVNVIRNVLYGRLGKMSAIGSLLELYSREERLEALELIQKVGLADQIYKRADTLSGGQMQRVGICRAIIQHPKILLADEPIASLDPASADIAMDQMKSIVDEKKLTCIVNLHQVEYARKYADRIIGIKDGRVVFDGKTTELTAEILSYIYQGKEDQMGLRPAREQTGDSQAKGELLYA
jgi:phosphonate transport system ATP-binding protein